MICANCAEKAVYLYEVTPSHSLYYCNRHLPAFLKGKAKSGELNIPVASKPAPKKKVVEPVLDEPTVEPALETADGDN